MVAYIKNGTNNTLGTSLIKSIEALKIAIEILIFLINKRNRIIAIRLNTQQNIAIPINQLCAD